MSYIKKEIAHTLFIINDIKSIMKNKIQLTFLNSEYN